MILNSIDFKHLLDLSFEKKYRHSNSVGNELSACLYSSHKGSRMANDGCTETAFVLLTVVELHV